MELKAWRQLEAGHHLEDLQSREEWRQVAQHLLEAQMSLGAVHLALC